MMHVEIDYERAMMRVRLESRLSATDFSHRATPAAERLCERCGVIQVLVLDVTAFDGWQELTAFGAQITFLKRFHRAIRRVALLGGPAWRGALPALAALFVSSRLRHFCMDPRKEHEAALSRWLARPLRE